MRLFALLCVGLVLTGCNSVFVQLPSVQNCQRVTYTREYSQVQIVAQCDLARDGLTGN